MDEIKIGKRGQVTIPKDIRKRYGFAPGITLKISEGERRIYLEPAVYCHHCGKVLSDEFKETRAYPGCPPIKIVYVY